MADEFDALDYNIDSLGADVTPEMLDTIKRRRELREAQQNRLSSPLQYLAAGVTGIGSALQGGSGAQAAQSQLDRLTQEKRILAAQEMQDVGALSRLGQMRQQKEMQNIKFQHEIDLMPFKEKMRMAELAAMSGNQQSLARIQNSLQQDLERLKQTGSLERLGKEQEFKKTESEKDRLLREKQQKEKLISEEKIASLRGNKTKAADEFKSLPKDTQLKVEELSKTSAKMDQGIESLRASLNQLRDPNLTEDQKVTIGGMVLKKLNDPVFSDAVGAEEVRRLGSYLELFSATRAGSTFGRDLPRFTEQVQNKLNSVEQARNALDSKVNNLMGRTSNKVDFKIINGIQYQRTKGGWQKVK